MNCSLLTDKTINGENIGTLPFMIPTILDVQKENTSNFPHIIPS